MCDFVIKKAQRCWLCVLCSKIDRSEYFVLLLLHIMYATSITSTTFGMQSRRKSTGPNEIIDNKYTINTVSTLSNVSINFRLIVYVVSGLGIQTYSDV